MENNSKVGLTFQKLICNKYGIIPSSEHAKKLFDASYDETLVPCFKETINDIFSAIKLKPVECTTLDEENEGKKLAYNFILSDNSTLSIRTNINGSKVAPRVVGQAGFEKLNTYFGDIYGSKIETQDDIKKLVYLKIEKCLPIFLDFLFDADYIVWIYQDDNVFKYHLIKGDSNVNIDFDRINFTFTQDLNTWNESTTLKYKGISIAEIQTHAHRSFKFRFIMKNLIPLITSKIKNTETLGITAEKVICDMYNLKYPNNFFSRYSVEMQYQLEDSIKNAFEYLPRPISHTGSEVGERGGASKCSYDFMLYGNKTLSLKTNIGKMVCPPEVGQPNDKTCYLYFKDLVNDDHIDKVNFKEMVYNNVDKMMPIYMEHMFDSDYLLRLVENREGRCNTPYCYEIYPKNLGENFMWEKGKFSFSKPKIEEWNESNTVYYDGISIGEFQVHNHRNCYKFRFNFSNLMKILKRK